MKPLQPRLRRANIAAGLICLFAFTAMIGDALQIPALKGLGAASAAAPCPKVFCQLQGLEGFACKFALASEKADGTTNIVQLTPEMYSRLQGPYNRRNVYGAALAFAPKLPGPMWQSVFCYGLGRDGPLRRELGFPPDATNISIIISENTRGRTNQWRMSAPCNL